MQFYEHTPPTSPFRGPLQQSPTKDPEGLRSPVSPTRLNSLRLTPDCENELLVPVTCKLVERDGSRHYRCGSVSMTGFRETMEDAHVMMCADGVGFFGVYDGHGGSHCSAFCAQRFPEEISRATLPLSSAKFEEITLLIDEQFCAQHPMGGSTAAMLLTTPCADKVGKYNVQIANVGDSRVIVATNTNRIRFATTDHKPNLVRERARIEKYGGMVRVDRVDGRLAMSRAMGDREFKTGRPNPLERKITAQPDITVLQCEPDDFVVVACDGIFENGFDDHQVVAFVSEQLKQTDDLGKVAARLCDEALRRGSSDNMTAMIIQFQDGTSFRSPPEFVPGPYCPHNHAQFRAAYCDMARKAGLSWENALDMRYKQLCDELSASLVRPVRKDKKEISEKMTHGELVAELKEVRAERGLPLADLQSKLIKRVRELLTPETYGQFCDQLTTAVTNLLVELQSNEPPSPTYSPYRAERDSRTPSLPPPPQTQVQTQPAKSPTPTPQSQLLLQPRTPEQQTTLPPAPATTPSRATPVPLRQTTQTVAPPAPTAAPEAAARAAAAAQKAAAAAAAAQATAMQRHTPTPTPQWQTSTATTPRSHTRSPFPHTPESRPFTPERRASTPVTRRQSTGSFSAPDTPRTPSVFNAYNRKEATVAPLGYQQPEATHQMAAYLPPTVTRPQTPCGRYSDSYNDFEPPSATQYTPTATRRFSATAQRPRSAPRSRSFSQPDPYTTTPAPTFHRQPSSQHQQLAPTHTHPHSRDSMFGGFPHHMGGHMGMGPFGGGMGGGMFGFPGMGPGMMGGPGMFGMGGPMGGMGGMGGMGLLM